MLLIVALPSVGVIIHSGFEKRNEDIEEAREEAQDLTESISNEQQNLVAGAQQLLSTLEQLSEIRDHNVVKAQLLFTKILKMNPQYLNLVIADRVGSVWVSAAPMTTAISIADRRHFINARTTRQFSSGECIINRLSQKPSLGFSYPILDQKDEFAGTIVVNFDMENYRNILVRSNVISGSNYLLVDHKGVILSRGLNLARVVGEKIKPELLRHLQEGPEEGITARLGDDDIERFAYFRKLRLNGEQTPYMYILAGIPVKAVTSGANWALYRHLALLTPFMLFALFLAWFTAKRSIVDRVFILEKGTQRLADGDLEVRISTLIAGGELGNLGRSFDAMAQQLAGREQALLKSERNYREIFNAAHDAIFVHYAETGKIIEANRSAEEMYGYSSDEFRSLSVHTISSGEQPYSTHDAKQWLHMAETEGPQSFEWLARRKEGKCFWVEVSLTSTKLDGKGRILAVVHDISSRKRAEKNIKVLNADLASRAIELEAANKELEAANKEQEAFSYTVSHDLRALLTSISLRCQIIMEMSAGRDDGPFNNHMFEIYLATKRIEQFITSLLDLSRSSRGILDWEMVDLSEKAKDIADELRFNQPKRSVQFLIEMGITARGDAGLLRIVLANLLGNAWKYTGKTENPVIEFGMTEDNGPRKYFVRDNGVGFDMCESNRLFGAFQRLHSGDEFEGHGIGLATVQRIIHRHGGRVWAESEVGKGAAFYFTLLRDPEVPSE